MNWINQYTLRVPYGSAQTYNRKEILINGKYLYVKRLRFNSDTNDGLYIHFNSPSGINQKFELRQGDYYNVDFDKVWLECVNARSEYYSDLDLILYYWSHGEGYRNFNQIPFRSRFTTFVASMDVWTAGETYGIFINTFGDLDVMDWYGNVVGINNIPAGSFIPINVKKINASTTCEGVIIYTD